MKRLFTDVFAAKRRARETSDDTLLDPVIINQDIGLVRKEVTH